MRQPRVAVVVVIVRDSNERWSGVGDLVISLDRAGQNTLLIE
jgi:hypothetical protein